MELRSFLNREERHESPEFCIVHRLFLTSNVEETEDLPLRRGDPALEFPVP